MFETRPRQNYVLVFVCSPGSYQISAATFRLSAWTLRTLSAFPRLTLPWQLGLFGGMKSDWMLSLSQLYHGCLHGLYRHLFESLPGLCDAPSFEGRGWTMPSKPQHTPQASFCSGLSQILGGVWEDTSKHWKRPYSFLNHFKPPTAHSCLLQHEVDLQNRKPLLSWMCTHWSLATETSFLSDTWEQNCWTLTWHLWRFNFLSDPFRYE